MRDEGFGLNDLSFLSQLALVITGFAFLDDTGIINAAPSVNMTGEFLFKKKNKTWSKRGKVYCEQQGVHCN